MQTEIQRLSDEYERQKQHCLGLKDGFIAQTQCVCSDHNSRQSSGQPKIPQTSSSTPPPDENIVSEETAPT